MPTQNLLRLLLLSVDVDDEGRVGNSLLQIWKLGFGDTKRNEQCYYGWLYLSTDSSKLMPIRDWAALLKPSPRWVNAPAPLSLHYSSPQRSLLRSVLESLCSCSSCLFLSRVFNQIASTTNLLSLPYST